MTRLFNIRPFDLERLTYAEIAYYRAALAVAVERQHLTADLSVARGQIQPGTSMRDAVIEIGGGDHGQP